MDDDSLRPSPFEVADRDAGERFVRADRELRNWKFLRRSQLPRFVLVQHQETRNTVEARPSDERDRRGRRR